MNATVSINEIEKIGRNLYKHGGRYYRMVAKGITPNGCWLIAPKLLELRGIDAATGGDVYGAEELKFDGVTGTVPAHYEFINMA